jgi:hypothetical protein
MRYTLNAVLASPSPPDGFTIADLVAKVRSLTGQPELDYTVRQAAYDLRKLRGKQFVVKSDRTRRYHVPGEAARTSAGLLTLREQVIAPILADVRRPGPGRPPKAYTCIDRDYDKTATECASSSTTSPSPRPHDNKLSILLHKPLV